MKTRPAQTTIYKLSSLLTDYFPATGSHILNLATRWYLGNPYNAIYMKKRDIAALRRAGNIERILVIGDSNIGDAVILQAAVTALRDYFSGAEIDCAISATARDLIDRNPDISKVIPVFSRSHATEGDDFRDLEHVIQNGKYDILFNFCTLIYKIQGSLKNQRVISFRPMAARFVLDAKDPSATLHIAWQTYHYIRGLFLGWITPLRAPEFKGNHLVLSDQAVRHAQDFVQQRRLSPSEPLIFYNPDASSQFSRIPFDMQVALLTDLTELPYRILMASGYSEENIEVRLCDALPESKRDRIAVIPRSTPIDAYAALTDFSDAYITADSGAMHIAAARKVAESNGYRFRNRTAVFSIFGASFARMYGYDSQRPGFFPANQDAPSRTYSAGSPCRNLTCINKLEKTCREVRCFNVLDTEEIVQDVREYLNSATAGSTGI
jgi:ADP-heptose:LPS heptosyltransferase